MQILEQRYGDADWFNELIEDPIYPVELGLWHASFRGVPDEDIGLPYQLAHIWTYLIEIGPVSSNGMGPVTIPFSEINAWLSCTGVALSRWEISLLRQCSQVWISAQYEAKKPESIPPWTIFSPESINDRRKRVSERLKMLGGSGKGNKK